MPGAWVTTDLRFHHTTVLARTQCIERMGVVGNRIHENTVCTSNPVGRGFCDADSGGPLTVRGSNVIVGLASWTMECGRGFPDVYTNVFSHLQFIERAMSN